MEQAEGNKKIIESEAKRHREQHKALLHELTSQEDAACSALDASFSQRIDSLQNNNDNEAHIVEFAQTTVQNLKQVLERKNELIQRCQARFLNKDSNSNLRESRKDKISGILLNDYDENVVEIEKMKFELSQNLTQTNISNNKNLIDQLGEASDLINAKETLIDQLQFSLKSAEGLKDDADIKY